MAIKQEYKDFFGQLNWPDIKTTDQEITIPSGKILEYNEKDKEYVVRFFYYNYTERKYEPKNTPQIIFDKNFDVREILYNNTRKYDISYFYLLKTVLTDFGNFNIIKISDSYKTISAQKGILRISPIKLLEIIADLNEASQKIKSQNSAVTLYFTNKVHNKHLKRKIENVTTTRKGFFEFAVDRFNLATKISKRDYEKFLNENDISALALLSEGMIKNEVFSDDFLRVLDDYFIKEKLQKIIKLGRKILNLKNTSLRSNLAKAIALEVSDSQIKQLETLWQRYFEKNLLYLVFSYKKIYPKVELTDIDSDKKAPDFIGINHYNGVDIIEIKTHLANAMVWDNSHKNFTFSHEMSKTIIQTMNYMDAIIQRRFQKEENKENITKFTEEENLYHPRGIIIISSQDKLTKTKLTKAKKEKLKRDFTKLRNSLQNIEILTFDEILKIADDYIKNIRSQTP